MKNLKKILALLVVMCIAIAPVTSFAAQDDNFSELVATLTAMGVIDETVSFKNSATASVTRQDLAVVIANVLDIAYFKSMCADVSETNSNFSKINAIVNLGIMSNDGEGKFNPSSPITYKDAANAFARALCLEVLYEGRKTDTFIKSIENELIVGVKYQDEAVSGKFVNMLLDALSLGVITMEGVDDEYGFSFNLRSGESLLSRYRNIYSVNGVVLANGRSAVDSADGLGTGKVMIGSNIYSAGTTDIESALGYRVYAYVDGDAGDKIIAYYLDRNNTLEIDGADIRPATDDYSITYRAENGKSKTITLNRYTGSLYNGVYGGALTEERLEVNDGKITLIDYNRDSKWDVVSILEYEDYVISGIDTNNKLIYDELGKAPLSYDPDEDDVTFILTDKALTVDEFENLISTGDVLTVAKSNNVTGRKSVIIEISLDKIDGIFRNVSTTNRTINIADCKYDATSAFLALTDESGALLTSTLTAKSQVRAYLNAQGKVCYITGIELDNMTEKRGYLMQVALVGTLSSQMQMRIFGMDGVASILSTSDSVKVDYAKKNASEAYDILTATEVPYDSDEDGVPDTTRFNDQLIIYTVDEDGFVSSIRTAEETPNPNSFSKDVVMDTGHTQTYMNNIIWTKAINSAYAEYYPNCGSGEGNISYEFSLGDTILYISGRDSDGFVEEKKIQWQTGLADGKDFANVVMYDINDANVAGVTIVESNTAAAADYDGEQACRYAIVEDIRIATDDEGDYIALSVWRDAKAAEFKIREIAMTQYPVTDNPETTGTEVTYNEETGCTGLSEIFSLIQEGDVLQLVYNEDEVKSFRRIFTLGARSAGGLCTELGDAKTIYAPEGKRENDIEYTAGTSDITEAGNLEIYGTVAGVDTARSVVAVSTITKAGTETKRVRSINNAFNLIYKMEVLEDGEVSVSVASIKDVKGGTAGSEILLHSRVGFARESLIIVRN